MVIEIFPLEDFPIINPNDPLDDIILNHLKKIDLYNGDVIVIAHTIVSKAEGNVINLDDVKPSKLANNIAALQNKDPRKIEVVLREAEEIVRMDDRILITATKHGFICANSAVDKSNSPGNTVVTLPKNSDESAKRIRQKIKKKMGIDIAIIISDTFGRPFRSGTINVAIGISGIMPLIEFKGKKDLYGYELKATVVSRADEICTAAGLIMGQSDEGYPIVIVRNASFVKGEGSIKEVIRPRDKDIFR